MSNKAHISKNLKATIAFGIASFVTSGINYLTTPIFTRLLTTAEYGTIGIYNSMYAIVSVVATLTLARPGIISVGLYEYRDNRWRYLSSMLGCVLVSTSILSFFVVLFWSYLQPLIRLPVSLVALMLLTCLSQPATIFWTAKNRYEYLYNITVKVTVSSAVLSQLLSIALVFFMRNSGMDLAVIRLWSAGAVNLTVAAVLYIYICGKGKKFVDTSLWKRTLIFALPLIPHYFGFSLLNGTDKIMILHMVSADKVGIYSLASVLSRIGSLLWSALCVSFTPFMYTQMGKRAFKNINEAVKPLLILIAYASLLISLIAPEIIRIMSTSEYLDGIYVVPPVMAGLFMHVVYDVFSNVSFFHKKSVRIMLATLFAAVINVGLNYICILRFGYLAAGYTTFVSYTVLAIMHYYNARKIEREQIFDARFVFLLALVVTIASMSCNLLYSGYVIRYMFAVLITAAVIIKRRYFIDALSSMKV